MFKNIWSWEKLKGHIEGLRKGRQDITTKLGSGVALRHDRAEINKRPYHFTQHGLNTMLARMGVPSGFYRQCSPVLQTQIMSEFQGKNADTTVLFRIDGDGTVRFVGSDAYTIYDDHSMIDDLQKCFGNLPVTEPIMGDGYTDFLLRMEDLAFEVGRKFIPCLRVTNSEVGKSSLKIQFYLLEEVCTNGMMAPHQIFSPFMKIHKGATQDLSAFASKAFNDAAIAAQWANRQSDRARGQSAAVFLEALKTRDRLPKYAHEEVAKILPLYGDTGLDVVSSLTQLARDTHSRLIREELMEAAGELLLLAA